MSKAIAFDTLVYANKLMEVGFTKQQTEVQTEAIAELINENLATKRDLIEMENRLIIKLGTMLVVAIGVIATLIKLL